MAKITSVDCKERILSSFASETGLSKIPQEWARLDKKGKKGEPIVRRFFSTTLYPIIATVIEDKGAIAGVRFDGVWPWHPEYYTLLERFEKGEYEGFDEIPDSKEMVEAMIKPSDFYVSVEERGGDISVALNPIAYWETEKVWYDQSLWWFVEHLECPHLRYERSEASFSADCTDGTQVAREMAALGFVEAPAVGRGR